MIVDPCEGGCGEPYEVTDRKAENPRLVSVLSLTAVFSFVETKIAKAYSKKNCYRHICSTTFSTQIPQ